MMQPSTIEGLTEEAREEISKGLKLFIQTELKAMEECGPNPGQPTRLYQLDTLIKIARERDYFDSSFLKEYWDFRNRLMDRYVMSED